MIQSQRDDSMSAQANGLGNAQSPNSFPQSLTATQFARLHYFSKSPQSAQTTAHGSANVALQNTRAAETAGGRRHRLPISPRLSRFTSSPRLTIRELWYQATIFQSRSSRNSDIESGTHGTRRSPRALIQSPAFPKPVESPVDSTGRPKAAFRVR